MVSMLRSSARFPRVAVALCVLAGLAGVVPRHDVGAQGRTGGPWVGTWATGAAWRTASAGTQPPIAVPSQGTPAAPPSAGRDAVASAAPGPVVPVDISDQTLRQIVHTSIGGDRVRVVFSNVFGTAPLTIGGAHVGLRKKDAVIVVASSRPLLFAGQRSTTIPPGAVTVSDVVDLRVPPQMDLAIDLYVPGSTERSTSPITLHNRGYQTNYMSQRGNHVGSEELPVMTTTPIWHWLARVEVAAGADAYAVVALGDSITDGFGSDTDTNTRWPDELLRRLAANPRTRRAGMLNVGIGGNRLISETGGGFGVNALARFDRDVLAQPGATHIIVLEGINDIGGDQAGVPSAAALIAAHRQLIERAHARGFRIYGATLTPYEGAAYWSTQGEATRAALNQWIRTSGTYDGVVDFDAAVRDPQRPTRFRPDYHVGDNLHPNSAGYKAMAAVVDLKLLERKKP